MDRREVSRVFRARLSEAMTRAATSQAALARRVGISRSTLAQLLSTDADRLPRADTVAAVATELKVSLDWLLGLSQVDKLGADILHESLQVSPNAQHPVDEQLIAWWAEAAAAKIRYVPGTLPVFAKTGDVLLFLGLFRQRLVGLFRRIGAGISHTVPALPDGSVDHGQAAAFAPGVRITAKRDAPSSTARTTGIVPETIRRWREPVAVRLARHRR